MRRVLAGALLAVGLAGAAGAADFTLTSADIKAGGSIAIKHVYNAYGCTGGNVSPSLQWSGAPAGTLGYAVTVFDPDAPGAGWSHWAVVNIPASVNKLDAGAGSANDAKLPPGAVQTTTDFDLPGYGGPCPPQGDKPHRYVFTVHALKVARLDLRKEASSADTEAAIKGNSLAKASFTATYGRK